MQKTEKLYYADSHMFRAKVIVLSCTPVDDTFHIILDRTCLFPEGGGQASDYGKMSGASILDVRERDEVITHVVDAAFQVGTEVELTVDEKRRADHCAQHTGEHIISGVAKTLFGATNCGFHLADTYSTLDFNIPLTDEQIRTLEDVVNEKVRENHRIYTEMVDVNRLQELTLRKKTDGIESRADIFRIVYIDGVDSCTCCGTHCDTTGQVGIIKITDYKKYKSGVRIWYLCGKRALDDYRFKHSFVESIANRFSTKQEEAMSVVVKQGDELASMKHLLKVRNAQLAEYVSKDLYEKAQEVRGTRIISYIQEGATMQELNMLAVELQKQGNILAMLFSCTGDEVLYTLSCTEGVTPPMNELCQAVNGAMNGKGGGRPTQAQGKAALSSRSQLEQALEQLSNYLGNAVNK